MNKWQKFIIQAIISFFHSNSMTMSMSFNSNIYLPSIDCNSASRLDGRNNEGAQIYSTIFFVSNCYQCLMKRLSATYALLKTTQVRLVHLYMTIQLFPALSNHRFPDFVKPYPRCSITTDARTRFRPRAACTVRVGENPPYGPETDHQGISRAFKNGAGCDRRLAITKLALIKHLPNGPCLPSPTSRAHETIWLAHLKPILVAFRFRFEMVFKFSNCTGIVFNAAQYNL